MDVFENSGTPKSSILIGFSIINHPFGVSLFLETPISVYFYHYLDVKPRQVVIIFRISQICCAFFWRWHDLNVYSCIRFQLQLDPPTLQKKRPWRFLLHFTHMTPNTIQESTNINNVNRPQGYHHVFYHKKKHQKINTQHKTTPSVLSSTIPWFNVNHQHLPPSFFPNHQLL